MSEGREQVKVSVRNLVEFVLRSGDIDNRRTAGAQKEAMLAGSRIHRKIQKRQGPVSEHKIMKPKERPSFSPYRIDRKPPTFNPHLKPI